MTPEEDLEDWVMMAGHLARSAKALGHEAKTVTDCPLCRSLQAYEIMWAHYLATKKP